MYMYILPALLLRDLPCRMHSMNSSMIYAVFPPAGLRPSAILARPYKMLTRPTHKYCEASRRRHASSRCRRCMCYRCRVSHRPGRGSGGRGGGSRGGGGDEAAPQLWTKRVMSEAERNTETKYLKNSCFETQNTPLSATFGLSACLT